MLVRCPGDAVQEERNLRITVFQFAPDRRAYGLELLAYRQRGVQVEVSPGIVERGERGPALCRVVVFGQRGLLGEIGGFVGDVVERVAAVEPGSPVETPFGDLLVVNKREIGLQGLFQVGISHAQQQGVARVDHAAQLFERNIVYARLRPEREVLLRGETI